MDDLAFVAEIRSRPDDMVPRLIYADWLDEQGDPRGELIRLQCQLADLPPRDAARQLLQDRTRQLLADYGEDWLAPLRALGAESVSARCFERGLLERVRMTARNFLAHGEELCRLEPALHEIELRDVTEVLEEFGSRPLPAQVRGLGLAANGLTAAHVPQLGQAPWISQIVALDLKFNRLADDGVEALTQGRWPVLRRMDLSSNRITANGALYLSVEPWAENLKELLLSRNTIGDDGAISLAALVRAVGLEVLDVASNGITAAGAEALTTAGMKGRLNLRGNRLPADWSPPSTDVDGRGSRAPQW